MFRILFTVIYFVAVVLLAEYVEWTWFRFICFAVAGIAWLEIGSQLQRMRKEVKE